MINQPNWREPTQLVLVRPPVMCCYLGQSSDHPSSPRPSITQPLSKHGSVDGWDAWINHGFWIPVDDGYKWWVLPSFHNSYWFSLHLRRLRKCFPILGCCHYQLDTSLWPVINRCQRISRNKNKSHLETIVSKNKPHLNFQKTCQRILSKAIISNHFHLIRCIIPINQVDYSLAN